MPSELTPSPDPAQGVFDTLLVQHGRAVNAEAHLTRLARSARELYGIELDAVALGATLDEVARIGDVRRVRLTVVPDDPIVRVGSVPAVRSTSALTLTRRESPGLGAHKWVDRRPVTTGAGGAWGPDSDPLLVDDAGLLLETGRGNVFVVREGRVITPPLDGRILPGTVRGQVLAIALDLGQPGVAEPLTLDQLASADEVFVTSSISGLRAVSSCDGVGAWPVGPVTVRLRTSLEQAWGERTSDKEPSPGP